MLLEKGKDFAIKTAVHIRRMFEKFGYDEVFGRSVVTELLGSKNLSASKLLSNLVQAILLNRYPDTEKENTSLKVDEDMQQSRD